METRNLSRKTMLDEAQCCCIPKIVEREFKNVGKAKRFVDETGIDAVAVAVGTFHRMQAQEAEIQYGRLTDIESLVKTPLVIHGSTGVRDEDLKKLAVEHRVAKVNIGTALRMAFGNTLRDEYNANPEEFDRIKMFKKPMQELKKVAMEKMMLLGAGK